MLPNKPKVSFKSYICLRRFLTKLTIILLLLPCAININLANVNEVTNSLMIIICE